MQQCRSDDGRTFQTASSSLLKREGTGWGIVVGAAHIQRHNQKFQNSSLGLWIVSCIAFFHPGHSITIFCDSLVSFVTITPTLLRTRCLVRMLSAICDSLMTEQKSCVRYCFNLRTLQHKHTKCSKLLLLKMPCTKQISEKFSWFRHRES